MDIKRNRRDAAQTGKWTDRDLPEPEGMCPPLSDPKGHGNQSSDNNIGWDIRAQSWQRGSDTDYRAIDDEKREQDTRFGVPYEDVLPAPQGVPPNCGATYQVASRDGDASLPNPHNFSSNPGFMSASTADMATSGNPRSGGTATIATHGGGARSLRPRRESGGTGVIGRSAVASTGNTSLPAPGDVDSMSEGGPQVISTGYGQ